MKDHITRTVKLYAARRPRFGYHRSRSNAGWVYKVLNPELELRANLRWKGDGGNKIGYGIILKLSTPCILAANRSFLLQLNARDVLNTYIYHQLPPI